MQVKERLSCAGRLKITSTNKDNSNINWVIEDDNLIVDSFGINVLHGLTADGVVTNYKIIRMGLGTGTTPATVSDLNITPPATTPTPVNVTISTYTNVGTYQIKFTGVLDSTEGNGHSYTEAGLFMANNALMARRVFTAKAKDSDSVWTLEWTLTFVPA